MTQTDRTERPVVLITGATRGIGRATAALLAARGYRVFGTSRNPPAATLDGFELLPLEVSDDDSVAACVAAVAERTGGRIDVLVNNVGTGILGAAEEVTAEEARRLFEVNVFGALRVTNAVLPHMRARRAGTIINMSSSGGIVSPPFAALYSASKFALEGYTEGLRHELRPLGIAAVIVAPGPVSTTAGDAAMRPARTIDAYAPVRQRADAEYVKAIRGGMDPARVADTILRVVRTRWPRPRYRVGAQSWALSLLRSVLPATAFDAAVRMALRRRGLSG
jgi:NAD(P)-dependent dehydrogenase (short-subunit alcohol dehydrogenase family)